MTEREHNPETTTGAETELVELTAPPAPPTGLDRPSATVEGAAPAPEDGAGTAAPAPSSQDTEEDAETAAPSSVSIRERMRQLEDRDAEGSPGFGVVGKFSEARRDRAEQLGEDTDA